MGPNLNTDASGNHFDGTAEDDDDNNEWHVGYDVQIQGIGIGNIPHEEATSDAVTDDDDENDSFYSDDDNNNDGECAEALRAGYRPLRLEAPEVNDSGGDDGSNPADIGQVEQMMSASPTNPFSRAMELPPPPKKDKHTFAISHKPNDITLNEDKIDEIKSTMSRLELAPPPWASALKDETLTELVRKLKHS